MLGNLVCSLMRNTHEHHAGPRTHSFSNSLLLSFYLQERPSWPRNQQRSPSTSRWSWSRSWRRLWKMPLTQRCVILQVSTVNSSSSSISPSIHPFCTRIILFGSWELEPGVTLLHLSCVNLLLISKLVAAHDGVFHSRLHRCKCWSDPKIQNPYVSSYPRCYLSI